MFLCYPMSFFYRAVDPKYKCLLNLTVQEKVGSMVKIIEKILFVHLFICPFTHLFLHQYSRSLENANCIINIHDGDIQQYLEFPKLT